MLHDPLFLKHPKGVVPTDRAGELAAPIAEAGQAELTQQKRIALAVAAAPATWLGGAASFFRSVRWLVIVPCD
jgi:hypothetical protein